VEIAFCERLIGKRILMIKTLIRADSRHRYRCPSQAERCASPSEWTIYQAEWTITHSEWTTNQVDWTLTHSEWTINQVDWTITHSEWTKYPPPITKVSLQEKEGAV